MSNSESVKLVYLSVNLLSINAEPNTNICNVSFVDKVRGQTTNLLINREMKNLPMISKNIATPHCLPRHVAELVNFVRPQHVVFWIQDLTFQTRIQTSDISHHQTRPTIVFTIEACSRSVRMSDSLRPRVRIPTTVISESTKPEPNLGQSLD